jgi:branched-chain amino acid transport system substrate-binding protein
VLTVSACAPLLALLATGCASTGTGAAPASSAKPSKASKCGLGNGKTATGRAIKLGAIVTDTPGLSFTDITTWRTRTSPASTPTAASTAAP